MKLAKKLAALGLIGIMAVGQSVSALAASFTVSIANVTLSGKTNGYYIKVKSVVTADTSHNFLKVVDYLNYRDEKGISQRSRTYTNVSPSVTESHYTEIVFQGSDKKESQFYCAVVNGYYGGIITDVNNFIATKTKYF